MPFPLTLFHGSRCLLCEHPSSSFSFAGLLCLSWDMVGSCFGLLGEIDWIGKNFNSSTSEFRTDYLIFTFPHSGSRNV
jgi:hypothetical protein